MDGQAKSKGKGTTSKRRCLRLRPGDEVEVAQGVSVIAYRGKDGTLVLEIDGADARNGENEGGPVLRVYLNDAAIYENPPYRS